jgi:hypothetical protein
MENRSLEAVKKSRGTDSLTVAARQHSLNVRHLFRAASASDRFARGGLLFAQGVGGV